MLGERSSRRRNLRPRGCAPRGVPVASHRLNHRAAHPDPRPFIRTPWTGSRRPHAACRRLAWPTLVAALAGGTLPALDAHAQAAPGPAAPALPPAPPPVPPSAAPASQDVRAVDPADLTGRDFAGLRLAIDTQIGPISFSARRAAAWTEDAPLVGFSGATLGEPVQRLLLRGDVSVTLGIATFSAARAVVWAERLGPSTAPGAAPGDSLYQVAVYFDRVGNPSAEAGTGQAGDRLLVTAVVDGPLTLLADALAPGRSDEPLVLEGERRLARFLADVALPGEPLGEEAPLPREPAERFTRGLLTPGESQPFEPGSPLADADRPRPRGSAMERALAEREARGASGGAEGPLLGPRGVVTVSAGDIAYAPGPEESALIVTGGAVVQYSSLAGGGRSLELTAERAVVFLRGGAAPGASRFGAEDVLGIYLEGNVVGTDGQFTLRGPQIYYDVKGNQAVAVDAVFWTYDRRIGLPLYVRAKSLRQVAANQVVGKDVRVSASSFFSPTLSIAAREMTITRERPAGEIARTILAARDVTPRLAGLPFFYWPSFAGDSERFVLRDVRLQNSSSSGFGVRTRLDAFGLLGQRPPEGLDAELLLDGWTKRGLGLGLDASWQRESFDGSFFTYIVPQDNGVDTLTNGTDQDRDGDFRGIVTAENRLRLSESWSLFTEGAYISDPTMVDAYFEPLAETRREFITAADLRYRDDSSAFSFTARNNFNDFVANEWLLQSLGYNVNKLPEALYARPGDDLLAGVAPGLLTWTHEYRVSRMALNFDEIRADERGFRDVDEAQDAFGIRPDRRIADRLRSQGFQEGEVLRFDTRQEFTLDLSQGPVQVTPFAIGRFTGYDENFDRFAAAAGQAEEDSNLRFWGGGGVRVGTSLSRVHRDAQSRALDIDGVRHVVEPSVTVWAAGTTRDQASLPLYDEEVESIAEGGAVRAGVSQTLQTRRGGPGRARTVDFLKLNADVVYSTNQTDRESPIGRWFEYRPEQSNFGEYAVADATWQATDAVALTANVVYDIDLGQPAREIFGARVQHSRDFSTFAEMRYLNVRDATYVVAGADLRLTAKYLLRTSGTYDTNRGEVQSVDAELTREFPDFTFGLQIGYDDITDEFNVGVRVRPFGRDFRESELRRLDQSGDEGALLRESSPRAGYFTPAS